MRNEAETRAELIDPALKAAGWGVVEGSRVRREVDHAGAPAGRGHAGEAGDRRLRAGLQEPEARGDRGQARERTRHRRARARPRSTPRNCKPASPSRPTATASTAWTCRRARRAMSTRYPTPDELWDATFGEAEAQEQTWRDRFSAIPFEDKGGQWQPRYYQHNAITKDAGRHRPGTGPHPADPGDGHRQDRHRLPDRLEALPQPLEPHRLAEWPRRGAGTEPPAAHPVPRRPQHPGRPGLQRVSAPSPRTRWCASTRQIIRKKGVCPRTAASSSRSSRPS